MSLAELESKLDFKLLGKTKQDSNAFLQNLTNTLNTLPTPPSNGWEKVKLDAITNIQSGGTPDRKIQNYWNGNINWIKSEVCQNCYVYEYQVKEKITDLGLQKSSAKLFKRETTLIALVGATIGKIGFLTFESATNQNVAGLYPKDTKILNTKYLYYASLGLYSNFKQLGNFAMANSSFIKNLMIPLPPLEIQTKITQSIETIQSQISFLDSALPLLQSQKQEVLKKYLF
ncbi:MAG: restriction endonuclease subunit S [Helicobacter sp.]|nr:restriction endonuclease subunit S [Helicobacter sp.]